MVPVPLGVRLSRNCYDRLVRGRPRLRALVLLEEQARKRCSRYNHDGAADLPVRAMENQAQHTSRTH
jgi:hypothetical protein